MLTTSQKDFIKSMSKYDPINKPALSHKSVFKFMDITDAFKSNRKYNTNDIILAPMPNNLEYKIEEQKICLMMIHLTHISIN